MIYKTDESIISEESKEEFKETTFVIQGLQCHEAYI